MSQSSTVTRVTKQPVIYPQCKSKYLAYTIQKQNEQHTSMASDEVFM
jgi:hypothetical protein